MGTVAPPQEPVKETTWRDSLPVELQTDPNIKDFKDLTTFAKSHIELRKTLGEKVSIPKDDAPEAEKQAFRERIGIPKDYDPEVYKVKGPELPEGLSMREDEVNNFAKTAHGLHLNPKQVQGVLDYYGQVVRNMTPNYREDMTAAAAAIRDEWGQASDRNLGIARRALTVDFPKDTVDKIEKAGLANDIGFIKAMYSRGKGLMEDGVIPTEVGQGMDSKGAQREIDTIMGDGKHPYYDRKHPLHQDAVDKVLSLNRLIYS